MYKLLFIALLLLLSACTTQQARSITPQTYQVSHVAPYSLEALDAHYHQGQ